MKADSLKKHIKNYLKKHPKQRLFARRVYGALKEKRYVSMAAKVPVDPKMILFEVFMGRQYGCNPRAIYEYMIRDERFSDYRFVWVFRDPSSKKQFPDLARAEVISKYSRKYFRYCAEAGIIVTNSNLDYRIQKKPGQVFLQTWHGTPLKRLRCDIQAESGNVNNTLYEIRMKNDIDVVRYDYFISPSAFATEKFISSFNMKALGIEDIIIETGYPRNDILFSRDEETVRRIREGLGIPEDKKVILYAPTFRDNQHDGATYVYESPLDFDRLRDRFGDEYVVLFRAHYFVADSFDFSRYEGFVINASALDDIKELYLISDLLITDYSSVFFDYANLERPILFYMYDLDAYSNDIRGFYIGLDELPGEIITEEDRLLDAIAELKETPDTYHEKYQAFNAKYNYLDDGRAAERVTEILLSGRG